ncbi:acetate kinase (plasmid) [Burkholderia sp. SFA1]|uniref:acetate/propionate family kinase n=1 Tax=unclassified Caballeronia TaxID=2646786 RepID=UPI001F01BA50|nr:MULTISPECIES: acetate/propionate family kinase [unclassified Caballeronia]MCE4545600.1 acetate/propionate family kinase [Caballeronia sp. PC1]MCE4572276.1 acetate/propionate family kinase [Caballeronia sp. CLC5]BBQ00951.1 acetate kinase [Burkholderia sp. SFA1]
MADVIMVLNAGSSSIKFSAFDVDGEDLELVTRGQVEGLFSSPHFVAFDAKGEKTGEHQWGDGETLQHADAIAYLGTFLRGHGAGHRLIGVGHRVVHGGARFTKPVLATPEVLDELDKLTPLAPLHQPHNLKPIRIIAERNPGLPQVACFDTAFHATQAPIAQAFALPESITKNGVRRYGFHGLSYEYIASALPAIAPDAARGRTVVAHLGNGASLCAMHAGKSVASTMGFTAVDGLMMGTRCGNLDPGVILYMLDELGMNAREIEDLLYRGSGLLGVSGVSGDMRALLASDDERARFAIDLYVYRIGRELGSMSAALQGLDAVVFTAGIGEHSKEIRRRVCEQAAWWGIELDAAANESGGPRISKASGKVSAWVIPTNEELMIARHAFALIDDKREGAST